jgi:hypothetical protein
MAVVVVAVALWAFQPWRLFTSTTVVEAAPRAVAPSASPPTSPGPVVAAADPVTVAAGSFVTHEHATTGRVVLLRLDDGSQVLRIEDLDTSDGPDLHVWLSDQPVRPGRDGWGVFDDGAYLDLGSLKGNKGDQNYPVPADADLGSLKSVTVWCARFRVSFGAATLAPV